MTLTFDLKIKRVHPPIIDKICVKFDQNTLHGIISIMFIFPYLPIMNLTFQVQ